MAEEYLSTTLSVGFGPQLLKPSVKITGHFEMSDGTLGIPLRVYPPDAKLAASVGTITTKSVLTDEIQGEMLRFSGSEVNLTYAPSEIPPPPDFLFGFDRNGEAIVFPPLFEYDMVMGSVKAYTIVGGQKVPYEFYGLVKVGSYKAEYMLFYYKPAIEFVKIGISILSRGVIAHYGTIAGYKLGTIELFEVPMSDPNSNTEKHELYRIVSTVIVDPSGEWELPQKWGPNYAGKYDSNEDGPEADTGLTKQRIHEYGYMTGFGFYWADRYPRNLLQPFDTAIRISTTNTQGFQPVITMVEQNLDTIFPGVENENMRNRAKEHIARRRKHPLIYFGMI